MSAQVAAIATTGPVASHPAAVSPDGRTGWEQVLQTWDEPTEFNWADYRGVSYENIAGPLVHTLAKDRPVSRLVLASLAPDLTLSAQPALALLRIANDAATGGSSRSTTGAAHRIAPTLAVTDQGPVTSLTALRIAASAVTETAGALLVAADRGDFPYAFTSGRRAKNADINRVSHLPDLAHAAQSCAVGIRLEHSTGGPTVIVHQGRQDDLAELCERVSARAGVAAYDRVVTIGLPANAVGELAIDGDEVIAADPAQQATGLLAEADTPGMHLLIAVDPTRRRAAVAVLPVAPA